VPNESSECPGTSSGESGGVHVSLNDISGTWTTEKRNTLKGINLKAESRQLVGVVGTVGSGKVNNFFNVTQLKIITSKAGFHLQSSLLYAILRELPLTGGSIGTRGRIAYASQDPWLFTGSVRENVLFGLPYRHAWYMQVLEACSMTRDIALFPHGDQTMVGEKGMSLSGGQKARVNLAR